MGLIEEKINNSQSYFVHSELSQKNEKAILKRVKIQTGVLMEKTWIVMLNGFSGISDLTIL